MSELIIDARGHLCPVPSLRLSQAMRRCRPGERLTLLATDPMARIDVPFLMRQLGATLIEVIEDDGVLRLTVETAAPAALKD